MGIMNYVVINIATLVFVVISSFFFKFEEEMKKKTVSNPKSDIDKEKDEESSEEIQTIETNVDEEEEQTKYNIIDSVGLPFLIIMSVMNFALANIITYIYGNSIAINLKVMFVVCMLWPIAYIDYRTKMIPNQILKVMLVSRLVFFVPEFIMLGNIPQRLLSMSVAVAAVFLACVLCCLLIKGAIGMGDVKLFCIMALFLALEGIWSAIFCSLIASFFISVFSLLTKRVQRKDNIPFAPAILFGTYLSVFLTGI